MVIRGVPQGSVLGSMLFFISINDLPNYVDSFIKLLSDDANLYFTAKSPTDCSLIHYDLEQMNEWSNCWLLMFNTMTCKVIHYGNRISHNQYTLKVLDGSTSILKEVRNECDLGITFDSKLSFNEHMANIANTANSVIGLIERSFQHMDEKMFLHLYKPLS